MLVCGDDLLKYDFFILPCIFLNSRSVLSVTDAELGCDVWFNIEKYIDDNILALSLPPESEPDDTVITTNTGMSGASTQVKKNVQFIPDKMMASLMKTSSKAAKSTKRNDDKADTAIPSSSEVKGSRARRWVYSDWQEQPGDSASSRRSQRKKRKEMLAQRVSAGWGCCLDCGAGDNGVVSPSEVSWSTLLLLRELRETVLISKQEQSSGTTDFDFDLASLLRDPLPFTSSATRYELCGSKPGTVHCLLWTNFKRMWTLLALDDYKDCAKFHTFLYEQVTSMLKDWFPAPAPAASLQPPMFPPYVPGGQLPPPPSQPFDHHAAPLPDISMHSTGPLHGQFPPPPESSLPVVVKGEQRQALHRAVRALLLEQRALWQRDVACMGGMTAKKWHDLIPEGVSRATVNPTAEAAMIASRGPPVIDLHSPQKDCALEACLCEIRDVYALDFVKEMLAE